MPSNDLTQYRGPFLKPGDSPPNMHPLAAALRGSLGQDEPGSVLDPQTLSNKSVNKATSIASMLSDLVPSKGAASLVGFGGTFIGKGARTWNAKAAEEAVRLLRAGHDPERVRQLTGTSLFPDNQLRQEITDHDAILLKSMSPTAKTPAGGTPLGNVLHHPGLQAAYPDILRNTSARVAYAPTTSGVYHENKIKVNAPDLSKGMSTTLHEVQHNIQDLENFGRGGSPEEFMKTAEWAARARGKDATWAREKAYQDYLRMAGEAEARLTQQRRMLTPEERRATPLDWDIPPETHILKFYR